MFTHPRLLFLDTFAHLFFAQESPWISRTPPKETTLVRRGIGKLFLLFANVEILAYAREEITLCPPLFFEPLNLILVKD